MANCSNCYSFSFAYDFTIHFLETAVKAKDYDVVNTKVCIKAHRYVKSPTYDFKKLCFCKVG